jgi:hypothetical protein
MFKKKEHFRHYVSKETTASVFRGVCLWYDTTNNAAILVVTQIISY